MPNANCGIEDSHRAPARVFRSAFGIRHSAFTLVELIISIALVLIVMLGINYVFRMTSQTISSGQQLNEQVRNNRGAQAVMYDDFSRVAPDGACLLLRSRAIAAFRNRADLANDRDYVETASALARQTATRTVDLDGDGVEETVSPATYNLRNHRVDVISFFARGSFDRQTGGKTTPSGTAAAPASEQPLLAPQSTKEAWIWYGHLRLPDNNNAFSTSTDPGAATASVNPRNFFASQWILARQAILLQHPDMSNPTVPVIKDRNGDRQIFFDASAIPATGTTGLLAPLDYSTGTNVAGFTNMYDSRLDIAGTSIADYRKRLSVRLERNPPPIPPTAPSASQRWWDFLFLTDGRRFQTNPDIVRPVTSASFAKQSPIFLQGASQFIVEYAGDFLKQNLKADDTSNNATATPTDPVGRYGDVIDVYEAGDSTDGEIDFYVQNGVRKIRWYGLPRDTNGDGVIRADQGDVVPLRDLWQTALAPTIPLIANVGAPFEKDFPVNAQPLNRDYLTLPVGTAAAQLNRDPEYTCAWGPADIVRPRMIRVTIVLDDPAGRLAEGQMLEYIFTLPQ